MGASGDEPLSAREHARSLDLSAGGGSTPKRERSLPRSGGSGGPTLPPMPLTAREGREGGGSTRAVPSRAPSLGPEQRRGGGVAAANAGAPRASSWHSSAGDRQETVAAEREREHKERDRERRRAAAEEKRLSDLERKVAEFAEQTKELELKFSQATRVLYGAGDASGSSSGRGVREAASGAGPGGYPSPRPPGAPSPGRTPRASAAEEQQQEPSSAMAALKDRAPPEERAPPEPSPLLLDMEREREMWDAKLLGLRAGLSFGDSRPPTAAAVSTPAANAPVPGIDAALSTAYPCGGDEAPEIDSESGGEDGDGSPVQEEAQEVEEEDEEEEPREGKIAAALREAGIEASSLAEAMAILLRRSQEQEEEEEEEQQQQPPDGEVGGPLTSVPEAIPGTDEPPSVGIGPAATSSRPTSSSNSKSRRWAADRARRKRELCRKRSIPGMAEGSTAGSRAETPVPG